MKCPNCGKEGCRYTVTRKKEQSHTKGFNEPKPRIDFNAKCSHCGWRGIIE